jgi:plastocyanin
VRHGNLLFLATIAALLASCSRQPPPTQQKSERTESAKPAVVYFHPDPNTAGVLSGKIQFRGKRPIRQKIDMDEDPQCSEMHQKGLYNESLVVNRNGTLANVFVYIKGGLEGKIFETPSTPVTIDQKGCWFEPRVLGIQTGQTLRVTNSDPVTHNIHPLAQINHAWNQSQSEGAMPLARRFTKPEVMIRVKCNIHSWMRAWIGVLEHPYFAVTKTTGTFQIGDIPPGTYTIAAWQEELGEQTQQVTIEPSGRKTVDFTFKGE